MTHEEITAALQELHFGELPEERLRAVEEHLAGCEECRALSLSWRVLHGAVGGRSSRDDHHLSTEEVVSLAIEPGALSSEIRFRLETHLRACADCADEVERCRAADGPVAGEVLTAPVHRRAARPWARLGTLAAGLLVALLLYPAYLGVVRLPETESTAASAEARIERLTDETARLSAELESRRSLGGAARLHLLSKPMRGETAPGELLLGSDDPLVLIGVDLLVPPMVPDEATVTFALTRAPGEPVASIERRADLVRRDIRETGVVTLVLSAGRIPEGTYRLLVTGDTPPVRIFETAFRIVLSD